jgi:hypothetical protein
MMEWWVGLYARFYCLVAGHLPKPGSLRSEHHRMVVWCERCERDVPHR